MSGPRHPGSGLLGRRRECEELDRLVASVLSGTSRVLVLRGEAGVGKTALLDYVAGTAAGCRIARASGVESEMELAFAGLHALCGPFLGHVDRLPAPQRDALRTAFGLGPGAPPDRFLVGLAALSLLAEVAEDQPLLCVVDDAQWLDQVSAQLISFVARRLLAERVGLVFAVREPTEAQTLVGLPELPIGGLDDADARALLESTLRGPLDERVRDRIVAETRGTPLALLELPRGLAPAELAGGFGLPDVMPLASRIERSFMRRVESLPEEAQRLLLVAAVDPLGDVPLLWRAAEQLGIHPDAASAPVGEGLIEFGARVRFSHPLLRSAVCRTAAAPEIQEVHRALAEAMDPDADPDRRAWHRAQGAAGPDAAVADELERAAERVQARGGVAAAAAFLARATELTPDPALRGARALAAAQAKLQAAAPEAALELIATAEMAPLDALQRARLQRLRAQVAFAQRRGDDAPPLLLEAAGQLEQLDPALSRETYLEALAAAIFADRDKGVVEAAQAAVKAPAAQQPPRPIDLLLDGLTTRFTESYTAAAPLLARAVRTFREGDLRSPADIRWLWLAARVAADSWDDEAWDVLTRDAVALARESGALTVLPLALNFRAGVHLQAGRFAAAEEVLAEGRAITDATGTAALPYVSSVLTAYRGREGRALELIQRGVDEATRRGEATAITLAHFATAVLYAGLGQYDKALTAAKSAWGDDRRLMVGLSLVELIEAAARAGERDAASDAFARLQEQTRASGTAWALGIEARSEALMSEGDVAETLYRRAIEHLERTRMAIHTARAHLVYGEWLRRENRRADAREQLRVAHDMFSSFGAGAFAERARLELVATGATITKRSPAARDVLTPQESQVARLAARGHTNPEIGARLFISPRTVEYHLRKVFTKLSIRSRRDLRQLCMTGAGGP